MRKSEARVGDPALHRVRLDVFISEHMGLFSRSQARARVVEVRVNGKAARLSHRLKTGDSVSVDYRDAPPIIALPERIPLDVIFENDDVVVVNKPQGMVVHPGSGNRSGTLVNALLFRYGELGAAFEDEALRPGIVHRLDKETSGVIITAKNPRAHEFLSVQFKARGVRKRYLAVLMGRPKEIQGIVETRIARDPSHRKIFMCSRTRGKLSVTRFKILRVYQSPADSGGSGGTARTPCYSFASLLPRTGRTHQLRVHMRHLSSPILGDGLYGTPDALFPEATLMLHAHRLSLVLPGEETPRVFTAPLPARFREVLRGLQSFSPRKGL